MKIARTLFGGLVAIVLSSGLALAATGPDCSGFNPKADSPTQAWTRPADGTCSVHSATVDGITYSIPDPNCTPGAVNPTLTLRVLDRPTFHTACERDRASSANAKANTYAWYGIKHPDDNRGANQVCELDHLISIEIGGADTLDNIWPQCGPDGATLNNRFFKQKDLVENYLAAQIRAGAMDLADVQKGIAKNWTQYLKDATRYYESHRKRNDGG